MQKTICKVVYDTEASTVVKQVAHGAFGDPEGYEETLYRTEKGNMFLYVNGGEASKHPKEDIIRMGKDKADKWLAENA